MCVNRKTCRVMHSKLEHVKKWVCRMSHMTQEENEKLKQAMQVGGVQMQPTTGMSPEGQS